MQQLAQFIANSEVMQLAYIGILMATMILPMIYLSYWYHSNIKKTEGGQALMRDQNSSHKSPRIYTASHFGALFGAKRNLRNAEELHKGIMSGAYGSEAKQMQIMVYKFMAKWLLALGVLGALPFIVGWLAN